MNMLMDLITNRIFVATAAAWLVAQVLKVIIDAAKNGFSAERLTGSGGMPSSHSATVTGLVVSDCYRGGTGRISFCYGFVFCYYRDLRCSRRAHGDRARGAVAQPSFGAG